MVRRSDREFLSIGQMAARPEWARQNPRMAARCLRLTASSEVAAAASQRYHGSHTVLGVIITSITKGLTGDNIRDSWSDSQGCYMEIDDATDDMKVGIDIGYPSAGGYALLYAEWRGEDHMTARQVYLHSWLALPDAIVELSSAASDVADQHYKENPRVDEFDG